MIDLLIPYLNNKIDSLGLFKNIIGLCEIITEEETSYPAKYCSKGVYKHASDFDYKKGLVYIRKNGAVSIESTENNSIGSENEIKITIPLKLVFAIKKNHIKGFDDAFIDDKMCLNLVKILSDSNVKSLKLTLKASTVSFTVQSWNTNRNQVWEEEYKGIPMEIDFDYVYGSIDFNANIEGSVECFDLYECPEVAAVVTEGGWVEAGWVDSGWVD